MFLTDKENACLIGDGNIVSKLINKSFLLHRWTLQQFATEIESKYVLAERGKCGKRTFWPYLLCKCIPLSIFNQQIIQPFRLRPTSSGVWLHVFCTLNFHLFTHTTLLLEERHLDDLEAYESSEICRFVRYSSLGSHTSKEWFYEGWGGHVKDYGN